MEKDALQEFRNTRFDITKKYMNILNTGIGMLGKKASLQQAEANMFATYRQMLSDCWDYFAQKGTIPSIETIETADVINAASLFSQYYNYDCFLSDSHDMRMRLPSPFETPDYSMGDSCFVNKPAINLMPCFEQGVMIVNKKRKIFWETASLKIDGGKIQAAIALYDFIRYNSRWNFNIGIEAVISDLFDDDSNARVHGAFTIQDTMHYIKNNFQDMQKLFHWGEKERFIFDTLVMKLADGYAYIQDELMRAVPEIFFYTIGYVNKKMNEGKKVKTGGRTQHRKAEAKMGNNGTEPKKLTRILNTACGDITFQSEKKPAAANGKLIRNYSVAAWKRRATMRTYKSGKTIYIKECICHRQALQGQGGAIPQSVIQVQ